MSNEYCWLFKVGISSLQVNVDQFEIIFVHLEMFLPTFAFSKRKDVEHRNSKNDGKKTFLLL